MYDKLKAGIKLTQPTLKQWANASFGREANTTIGSQVRYERKADINRGSITLRRSQLSGTG